MTCTDCPPGITHQTKIPPVEAPSGMIPLFARVWPARPQLIVLESGPSPPEGYTRRSPKLVGLVMVRFSATALAEAGTPQTPARTNSRCPPDVRAGPPRGPFALRVSTARHGVTV